MSRDWNEVPRAEAKPDFNNLLAVLRCETPPRPTLFEFFLNGPLHDRLCQGAVADDEPDAGPKTVIQAFYNAGYDYVTMGVPGFHFPAAEREHAQTVSLNDGQVIADRESFEAYGWVDPDAADYDILDRLAPELPDGMKFIVNGPGGVEENVIKLVGYENLCFMMADDPELVDDIFEGVGSRLARYYENVVKHESVGACISNDDWGFKTQPLLSTAQMERYLYPWHKRITDAIHAGGRPAILHSCGNQATTMDVIIDELNYDGKHSYEDAIQPVEEAYEQYQGRIAVLGGIDVDFVVRGKPEDIYERSKAMLDRAADRGGYGLGTGNSVPQYVPDENYFAMINAALDQR